MSANPGRRAMRNTVAYMAAGLIPNFVNLFILPVYTRFVDPGEYGLVALVVTTTTFLGAFMGLQLTNSIHRLYFDYEGEERRVYCSTMILSILL
ncbi:MAG: oligosaccharide flippase family protein, partial [Verrucomicrobia bacterium]|nr:oligosaccharide flippase family protein [Verrucomicrobiota bacterium]